MTATEKADFKAQLAKAEALELAHAGLLIASYLGDSFDPGFYLNRLASIAEAARPEVMAGATLGERIETLNDYLFRQLGFHGNRQDYYSPDNSFLNKVLEHRTGIPIALSVVYLEIGWLLDLPLYGVGMPIHFIVGCEIDGQAHFIDVFNGGKWLTEEDCLEICQLPRSDLEPFRAEHLQAVTKKAILFRMLLNLKQIYVASKDWASAYKVVDLMLEIDPLLPGEIRDRGLLAYRLNHLQAAIFDLNHYLSLAPDRAEAAWLREHVAKIEAKLLRSN
jgi:regulator of sirC expression with transglutaminase-like and TPR domain